MLYFSSYCIPSKNIKKTLYQLIKADIYNLELSSGEQVIPEVKNWLLDLKQKYQLNFLIHNYFPPSADRFVLNLASQDKIILNKTIEHCKKAITLADLLDIPIYSVHAGFRIDPKPSELGKPLNKTRIVPYDVAYSTMAESLKELCEFARNLNIDIAVENHELNKANLTNGKNELLLMCEASEYLRLFDDVKKDNLKILVDAGHLNVTATTLKFDKFDFVNKVRHKIVLFHLSDNNGLKDEHKLITENSWFWSILQCNPHVNCVIESHNLTSDLIDQTQTLYQRRLS